MRWAGQKIDAETPGALPGLGLIQGLVRSVTTPEFQGITFHEVLARSALNSVPGTGLPFNWTVNPYRGCTHACRYCFARPSHRYLELDQGLDFDQQIVVKTNVADVLRRELARPSWRGEQVALGTNTDPYQRAEGRYRLMPGIIDALASSGTPLSILTKGTLLRRDLGVLAAAAEEVPVGVGVSLALADEELRKLVEPGVPSVRGRLRPDPRDPRGGFAVWGDGCAGAAVADGLRGATRPSLRGVVRGGCHRGHHAGSSPASGGEGVVHVLAGQRTS